MRLGLSCPLHIFAMSRFHTIELREPLFCMLIFVFSLVDLDLNTLYSFPKAAFAFPILIVISLFIPPSPLMLLPKYVKFSVFFIVSPDRTISGIIFVVVIVSHFFELKRSPTFARFKNGLCEM